MRLRTVGPSIFTWMFCLFPLRLPFLLYILGAISLFHSSCFLRIGPLFFIWIYLRGIEQRRRLSGSIFILSLGIASWIRVEGRLVWVSEKTDMDQQVVTVDQFMTAMASIQEALANLRQEIGGHQSKPPVV